MQPFREGPREKHIAAMIKKKSHMKFFDYLQCFTINT